MQGGYDRLGFVGWQTCSVKVGLALFETFVSCFAQTFRRLADWDTEILRTTHYLT